MPIDESLIEEMTREFFNGQYPYVKVVPRLEATDKTSFARGATLFAKVKEKYIAHLTRGTERENRKSLLSRWTHVSIFDGVSYVETFGRYFVTVEKHRGGWTVARHTDYFDDARVLTTTLGDFPVLFPSLRKAVAVVEVCVPDPPPGMIWNAGIE